MREKYEISIWNDIPDEETGLFKEEKIIIIGSNTMTSENRAREPKLVTNINGTNKFTFNMYYSYIDTRTGEKVKNPYINFLINERKIKVFWKDKWYDFLIKQIKEDQVQHFFSYTCEDAFINELSRTGFNLTFATELQNNIGTAKELIERVIENTDWQFDEENSDKIYQEIEEPVYESTLESLVQARKAPTDELEYINPDLPILVYYSCVQDINNLKTPVQFYYNGTTTWEQDENDMLVINGNCYSLNVTWRIEDGKAVAYYGTQAVFRINFGAGLSTKYRAKRYVQSQKTIYNDIVDRYVNVYNEGILLGYEETEFNDALAVVNVVTNPSNFSNVNGWVGEQLSFKLSPPFDQYTDVSTYKATSYLYLKKGTNYFNTGIQNNRSYIKNGFIVGERYIFRIKAKEEDGEPANTSYVTDPALIYPSIEGRDFNYQPTNIPYFNIVNSEYIEEEHWLEYTMQCVKSCPYDMILNSRFPFGIFINTRDNNYWIEEVQFFKEIWYDKDKLIRINPGEMNLQSVSQVWRYFNINQPEGTTKDNLTYIHTSLQPWADAIPVTTDYEKYATIEESNSNRFNILQSIAEAFKCWIFFDVKHDDKGYILYKDGVAQKFIRIQREAGQETGIGFIYGIDLKGVVRNIKSDKISTKTIVEQNENEFGKNGFCTIARSEQNYPRENFIYNFDYYIQQGLLNRDTVYNDLYNTIGYYSQLHTLNVQYAKNLDNLTNKKMELAKQTAMSTVYNQYILASRQELQNVEDSIIKLAGVESMKDAVQYAKQHANDSKLESLINDRANIQETIRTYEVLYVSITESITMLLNYIDELNAKQTEIIADLTELNKWFYTKYSRFIQEGTWTSEDYWNDDLYYLDAVQVAYTSSRPQISYDINVLRLSDIAEYSSKKFYLGDISFVQDVEYFGYKDDKITPYKEKVILTEITSFFDTPDKDIIKVQNYKTQFDDLFQRITATVQNLEFSQGKYAKAANIVASDGTIRSSVIQNTFNENKDLVYGAQNESATIDNTGITVTDNSNANKQVKITSGGIFVTNDAGLTWKNAIRGDGISTDLLTAGKINTEQITVYNGTYPSFRWDPTGLNAYRFTNDGVDTTQFVRFDKFGVYGMQNAPEIWMPGSEQEIYERANFGVTWSKFFMKNSSNGKYIEISTDRDIVVNDGNIDRIVIGRIDGASEDNYGIRVRRWNTEVTPHQAETIFECSDNGSTLSGWTLKKEYLESKITPTNTQTIRIQADGNIGCYGHEAITYPEAAYQTTLFNNITVTNLKTNETEILYANTDIYVFSSQIGRIVSYLTEQTTQDRQAWDTSYKPSSSVDIQIAVPRENNYDYYLLSGVSWSYLLSEYIQTKVREYQRVIEDPKNPGTMIRQTVYVYDYTGTFTLTASWGGKTIFGIGGEPSTQINYYIPAADTKWSINKNGQAIFHDIYADYGKIAGWFIDTEKIYQTTNGKADGPIKQQLSTVGSTINPDDYSFITDAIKAAIAEIGGLTFQNGLIDGYSLAAIYALAVQASADAATALYKATYHSHTYLRRGYGGVANYDGHVPGHTHSFTDWEASTGTAAPVPKN